MLICGLTSKLITKKAKCKYVDPSILVDADHNSLKLEEGIPLFRNKLTLGMEGN
jgi:hypothetical protein